LKSEVVDHYKGKFELESMDDVLPLSIYCTAMAELSHGASLRNIMEDYLRLNSNLEFEKKLLCNFDCAVRYVSKEWVEEYELAKKAKSEWKVFALFEVFLKLLAWFIKTFRILT